MYLIVTNCIPLGEGDGHWGGDGAIFNFDPDKVELGGLAGL
jgi:hypothetical protein